MSETVERVARAITRAHWADLCSSENLDREVEACWVINVPLARAAIDAMPRMASLLAALELARSTCGCNNMNCPGSSRVKAAIDAALKEHANVE